MNATTGTYTCSPSFKDDRLRWVLGKPEGPTGEPSIPDWKGKPVVDIQLTEQVSLGAVGWGWGASTVLSIAQETP